MGERKLQILSRSKGEFGALECGRYKEITSRGVGAFRRTQAAYPRWYHTLLTCEERLVGIIMAHPDPWGRV
jgi:hypothetical protein